MKIDQLQLKKSFSIRNFIGREYIHMMTTIITGKIYKVHATIWLKTCFLIIYHA